MQPDAYNATYGPTRGSLEWGQLNFLHTTDTHGWLEGHLTETNYGADWGDFVSFTAHMRAKARELGVDLLLVDTGDLHDGAGLSDATTIDGQDSNVVFENLDYDLLTIGKPPHFGVFPTLHGLANICQATTSSTSQKLPIKTITSFLRSGVIGISRQMSRS